MMHTITLTPEQINRICLPDTLTGRYLNVRGTGLLVRTADNRVVSVDYDFLTDEELTQLRAAWKGQKPAQTPTPAETRELDRRWAETAVEREIDRICDCRGDNPHKPDSEYWKSLCRLAGIVKGTGKRYLRPDAVLFQVLRYSPKDLRTKGDREKDITYLWGRAMNRAPARFRADKTN